MKTKFLLAGLLTLTACGESGRALYPLGEGLTWEYQISAESLMGQAGGQRIKVSHLPPRQLNGRTVVPQKLEIGPQSQFSFIVSDGTGVYAYARQLPGAVEPEIHSAPEYLLRFPLNVETTWEGKSEIALPMGQQVSVPTRTHIESVDETVTVPAGTFDHCVKTKAAGEVTANLGPFMGAAKIGLEEHSWFCPGVGMVKSVQKRESKHLLGGTGQIGMELAVFKR